VYDFPQGGIDVDAFGRSTACSQRSLPCPERTRSSLVSPYSRGFQARGGGRFAFAEFITASAHDGHAGGGTDVTINPLATRSSSPGLRELAMSLLQRGDLPLRQAPLRRQVLERGRRPPVRALARSADLAWAFVTATSGSASRQVRTGTRSSAGSQGESSGGVGDPTYFIAPPPLPVMIYEKLSLLVVPRSSESSARAGRGGRSETRNRRLHLPPFALASEMPSRSSARCCSPSSA